MHLRAYCGVDAVASDRDPCFDALDRPVSADKLERDAIGALRVTTAAHTGTNCLRAEAFNDELMENAVQPRAVNADLRKRMARTN
jgi:hypothetical protein